MLGIKKIICLKLEYYLVRCTTFYCDIVLGEIAANLHSASSFNSSMSLIVAKQIPDAELHGGNDLFEWR